METEKEEVFAQLLFEKYEEKLAALHAARKARYEAEVDMLNIKETIALIQFRIQEQSAHEQRLADDAVRAQRETDAYNRGKSFAPEV